MTKCSCKHCKWGLVRRIIPKWPHFKHVLGDVSCTAPAMRHASLNRLCSSSSNISRLQNPHVWSLLWRCRIHCAWHEKWRSLQTCGALKIWLRHVLRAAAVCTFWMLNPPDGPAPAALYSQPTFRPFGTERHWKTHRFATLLPFCPLFIFFLLALSPLGLPRAVYASVHKSETWLLKSSELPSVIAAIESAEEPQADI